MADSLGLFHYRLMILRIGRGFPGHIGVVVVFPQTGSAKIKKVLGKMKVLPVSGGAK